jgi:PKHD-type hydroxylase
MDPRTLVNDAITNVGAILDAFTPEECDRLIRHATVEGGKPADVVSDNRLHYRPTVRRSTIRWVNNNPEVQWMFERLNALVLAANQHYRFDIYGFIDPVQVAEYGVDDHFDWHVDLSTGMTSLRKLSISVQLSDPADYDGGELEFHGSSYGRQPTSRGAAILFPSFVSHRVTPITRGTRFSLVAWASGPAFK